MRFNSLLAELGSRLESARSSPAELDQLAASVSNVSVRVTTAEEEAEITTITGLPFLDVVSATTTRDALVRIEQVLRSVCPEFDLQREAECGSVTISSGSLLRYYAKKTTE